MTLPHPFNSLAAIVKVSAYIATVYAVAFIMWGCARVRSAIQ